MIKIIYKTFKSLDDLAEDYELKGEYGYFEIRVGDHSYGDIPALMDLELSSSIINIWFESIAKALILLKTNPIVYVADIESPRKWIKLYIEDEKNIQISYILSENDKDTKLVQIKLHGVEDVQWQEIVDKQEFIDEFIKSFNSYITELKTLNSPDDYRIVQLEDLLAQI